MNGFLVVFVGGGLGAAARHGVNVATARWASGSFPWGTLFVNVLGSLVIGVLAEWFALRTSLPAQLRLFLITGILGGFTTFSAFALEIGVLQSRGDIVAAVSYALASVLLGVAAMYAGMFVVRGLVAA